MEKYKYLKFDSKTPEGTITRGCIYTEKPSFNYLELLKNKNRIEETIKLKKIRNELSTSLRINKIDLVIDYLKYRILTSKKIVLKYLLGTKWNFDLRMLMHLPNYFLTS